MTVPTLSASPVAAADVLLPGQPGQPVVDDLQNPDGEPACDVCPHPLASHDPIGLRFCRATTAGATSRGCICRTS